MATNTRGFQVDAPRQSGYMPSLSGQTLRGLTPSTFRNDISDKAFEGADRGMMIGDQLTKALADITPEAQYQRDLETKAKELNNAAKQQALDNVWDYQTMVGRDGVSRYYRINRITGAMEEVDPLAIPALPADQETGLAPTTDIAPKVPSKPLSSITPQDVRAKTRNNDRMNEIGQQVIAAKADGTLPAKAVAVANNVVKNTTPSDFNTLRKMIGFGPATAVKTGQAIQGISALPSVLGNKTGEALSGVLNYIFHPPTAKDKALAAQQAPVEPTIEVPVVPEQLPPVETPYDPVTQQPVEPKKLPIFATPEDSTPITNTLANVGAKTTPAVEVQPDSVEQVPEQAAPITTTQTTQAEVPKVGNEDPLRLSKVAQDHAKMVGGAIPLDDWYKLANLDLLRDKNEVARAKDIASGGAGLTANRKNSILQNFVTAFRGIDEERLRHAIDTGAMPYDRMTILAAERSLEGVSDKSRDRLSAMGEIQRQTNDLAELAELPKIQSRLGMIRGPIYEWAKSHLSNEKDEDIRRFYLLVNDLNAEKIHEKYGAVLPAQELARAAKITNAIDVTPAEFMARIGEFQSSINNTVDLYTEMYPEVVRENVRRAMQGKQGDIPQAVQGVMRNNPQAATDQSVQQSSPQSAQPAPMTGSGTGKTSSGKTFTYTTN